jgi:predicted nucleotidyltransferase
MVLPCLEPESSFRVEFIFSFTPYERGALQRALRVNLNGTDVRFASAEDLIIHKIFAGRPRDLEDVRGILLKNKELDLTYLRRWLKEFDRTVGEAFSDRFEEVYKNIGRTWER